jgi:hypothetical protein
MYKTNKLFAKYLKVLEEQAPEGDPAAGVEPATAAASAPPAEPQEQVGNIDENEKYIIKILTNAFIFNPNKFKEDRQKYKYIFNKIDSIGKMVNVPVSEIIREIKKIIALDKSLRIESKTLKIINKYIFLLEQPADATEPQTEPSTQDTTPRQPAGGQVENSENKLNLAEIFPLYQELILKALRHTPSEEELMIIKPVVNEFADSDPEKIVEAIQNILSQSLEDKEVEDNLSNA